MDGYGIIVIRTSELLMMERPLLFFVSLESPFNSGY